MAGKDGSTWHHNWVPTNAQAAALKAHRKSGGKSRPAAPKRASGAFHPGLSKSYVSGNGASKSDVSTLAARFKVMHGRAPTKAELAKIKRKK